MADNNVSEEDGHWTRPPYAWIITPLLIFVLIAIAATLFQLRRRAAMRRSAASRAQGQQQPPGATDLEAGRNTRTRRWVGMRRREEPLEGLDEYGEAPPPYEPAAAKRGDVELSEVAGSPPEYGEDYEDGRAVAPPPAAVTRER